MPLPLLPIELWLVIFRWATISRATKSLSTTAYHPFQADAIDVVDRDAIAVKRALVHVCKLWRRIATGLLLEDVVVREDGGVLKRVLEGQDRLGCAAVRRACVPYSSCVSYKTNLKDTSALLADCAHLEVLVRPTPPWKLELAFDFPAEDCPPLPSLKRLDWWHDNDAARTGGLNSLTDVARAAPNLEYLSLGGDMCMSLLSQMPVALPALTTLRIRPMNVLLLLPLRKWKLPALAHIIVDTHTNSLPDAFWAAVGAQVRTVELGASIKFCLVDMVQYVLGMCPGLEALSYYVQFVAVPCVAKEHAALTTVRLHAAENGFFADEGNGYWEHLEGHFDALASACFPALKRVVLHGSWGHLLSSARFQAMKQKVLDAGREITMVC